MKLRTKLLALLLAAAMVLSLAACSGSTDSDPDFAPEVSNTTDSANAEEFVPDPNVEDLYLAVTGIPSDYTLITASGIPISARMYLYWLARCTSELESEYLYYGTALDWEADPGLAPYLMDEALSYALNYTLVPAMAKEKGFDLTAEQIAEFEALTAETIESIGGEEEYNELLRILGLDQDTYLAINRAPYYYRQLLNVMFADRPNDDDLAAYVEEHGVLGAKHILLLTMDMTTRQPLADDVIAQKKATAEDILKQLQESDDPDAAFDALMHQYSEDGGLTGNPDGYTFWPGQMVSEFEEGTRALEIGQISGIVESSYGYHIILRQEPDFNNEELRSNCLTTLASNEISSWISESDIVFTDEYRNLDAQNFYEKFMAYQVVFSTLRNAES